MNVVKAVSKARHCEEERRSNLLWQERLLPTSYLAVRNDELEG